MFITARKVQNSILMRCTLCVVIMIILVSFLAGCGSDSSSSNGSSSNSSSSNSSISTIPTPTPTPQSSATWNAIINDTATGTTFTDPENSTHRCTAEQGSIYLAIDVSFVNISNQTQVLSDDLLDLQDTGGGHYKESQCAGPSNQWVLGRGESIHLIAVFLVPNTGRCFTLFIIDSAHNVNDSWTIGCK